MKAYKGYEAKKDYGDGFGRLPAGNYVGKIKSAKVEEYSWGTNLVIAFDIIEGEYEGYYQKQLDLSESENKKWKGVCRLRVPNPDSQYFASEKKQFENAMYSIEESNKGYHWDWDESKLKGKVAGFRFRDKEFKNDFGEVVEFTECLNIVTADDVRNGKAKLLKPKKLKEDSPAPTTESFEIISSDDDDPLPF